MQLVFKFTRLLGKVEKRLVQFHSLQMRKTEKASFVVLQSGTDDGYYKCEEMPFFEIGSVHYEEYLVNIRLPAVKTNEKVGPVADIHFVVSYINKLQSIYQGCH